MFEPKIDRGWSMLRTLLSTIWPEAECELLRVHILYYKAVPWLTLWSCPGPHRVKLDTNPLTCFFDVLIHVVTPCRRIGDIVMGYEINLKIGKKIISSPG